MSSDLRYAIRSLSRSPGFTTVAVLCLAFGIGANTAIFSLLDAAMLRPLPVADPSRLVIVEGRDPAGRGGSSFSYPMFAHLREHASAAADLFAYGRLDANFSAQALTDVPTGLLVSDNYFSALGVQPAAGRMFTASDDAVLVLSYRYWHARFGGDPAAIGRGVVLNGLPFTIVGVTPRQFFGTELGKSPDLFVPLALRDRVSRAGPRLAQHNSFWLRVMGRLAPDVTVAQATAQLGVAYEQYVSAVAGTVQPGLRRFLQQRRMALAPGAQGPFSIGVQFGRPLWILMAIASAVLLIACANVASLLLARGTVRQREIAIRLALGARRMRLARQLLTESAVLSAAGAGLGLLFGLWSANALTAFLADRIVEVRLDARMLGFTLFVSAITVLLFGGAPALRTTRTDLSPAFRSSTSGALAGRLRLGRLLVPAQVALSLLLLVAAGLFIRTLTNLRTMDAGFRGDRVLLATTDPGLNRYTPDRVRSFYAELVQRASGLPGVESATLADGPLLGTTFIDGISIEGSKETDEVSLRIVGPRFFDTMGIRLFAGRDFSDRDTGGAPPVVIVNETIARKYFAGRDPIGKRVGVTGTDATIVGVIGDTKYRGLRDAIPNTVYVPMEQSRFLGTERTLHLRTARKPADMTASVRQLIRTLDSGLPAKVRPFSQLVDANLERERLVATLGGFFAGLALLLTAIGLYGVIAHDVQRRTREIGIRMSLGAEPHRVLRMVQRDCLTTVVPGIAAGLALSLWLSRLVRAQLFDVSPRDPVTLGAAAAILVAVAALAGYLPARRAARVDPVGALRYE